MTEYSHTQLNDLIEKYRNGTISEEERFRLEKQAMDDPFLFDALEGYTLHDKQVLKKKPETKIFTIPRIGIAASLIIFLAVMYNLRNEAEDINSSRESISMVLEKDRDAEESETKAVTENGSTTVEASKTDKPIQPTATPTQKDPGKPNLKKPLAKAKKNIATNNKSIDEISSSKKEVPPKTTARPSSENESIQAFDAIPKVKKESELLDYDIYEPSNSGNQLVANNRSEEVPIRNAISMPVDDSVQLAQGADEDSNLSAFKKKLNPGIEPNISYAYIEAIPVIGKEIFDDYAKQRIDERGLRQTVPQKVVIEFSIDEKGGITDFKHIYSGCSECGAFAIAILQNSGEWKTKTPGYTGRVRYTFTF